MLRKSILSDCRYIAIGVLVGICIFAIDESQGRYPGSTRVERIEHSLDWLDESFQLPDVESLFDRQDEEQQEVPASIETAGKPDPWRSTPYIVNGEIRGYRLFPGADRALFRSLGLKPGDLVTEIDGQPLNEPAVASELFGKALSGQPVIFGVLRGDELEKIEVKID